MLSNHPAVTSLWQPLLTVTPLWVHRRFPPQCHLWRAFLRENTHYSAIKPDLIDWHSQTFWSARRHRRLWLRFMYFLREPRWKYVDSGCAGLDVKSTTILPNETFICPYWFHWQTYIISALTLIHTMTLTAQTWRKWCECVKYNPRL